MDTRFVDSHIGRLKLAREMATFGARVRIISAVSGVGRNDLVRLFNFSFAGPNPTSINWLQIASSLARVESALFASLFERLRKAGHGSSVSLVAAYGEFARSHRKRLRSPEELEHINASDMLSFDRAFYLAANLALDVESDGALWLSRGPQLTMRSCPECKSRFITAKTAMRSRRATDCPLCRIQSTSRRVQLNHLLCSPPAMPAVPPLALVESAPPRARIAAVGGTSPPTR